MLPLNAILLYITFIPSELKKSMLRTYIDSCYSRCDSFSKTIDFLAIVLGAMCLINLNQATPPTMLRRQTKIPLSSVQWNFRRIAAASDNNRALLVLCSGMHNASHPKYDEPIIGLKKLDKITTRSAWQIFYSNLV